MSAEITVAGINSSTFRQGTHYNMGKAGFGWGYDCNRYPRLSFIERFYRPSREYPDGLITRAWYVDGAEVPSIEAAAAALNQPIVLTDDEKAMLELIPDHWKSLRRVEDDLAGVPHPTGAIMPDTPHSRVLRMMDSLRAKGVIELGRKPERDDGEPWHEGVPEHLRWSPTVRRVPTR